MTTNKEKYTYIYQSNYWASKESVSGLGSELASTENIRLELPNLIKKHNIKTVLDCPCGDYNWMSKCNLDIDFYIGADIVDDLINSNQQKYGNNKTTFKVIDICNESLPKVDLIIIKDLFLHLSYEDIFKALNNVKQSGSKYVLISNSTKEGINEDKETGGSHRGIYLHSEPFNFKESIDEIDFKMFDTKLSMWEINSIKL